MRSRAPVLLVAVMHDLLRSVRVVLLRYTLTHLTHLSNPGAVKCQRILFYLVTSLIVKFTKVSKVSKGVPNSYARTRARAERVSLRPGDEACFEYTGRAEACFEYSVKHALSMQTKHALSIKHALSTGGGLKHALSSIKHALSTCNNIKHALSITICHKTRHARVNPPFPAHSCELNISNA